METIMPMPKDDAWFPAFSWKSIFHWLPPAKKKEGWFVIIGFAFLLSTGLSVINVKASPVGCIVFAILWSIAICFVWWLKGERVERE